LNRLCRAVCELEAPLRADGHVRAECTVYLRWRAVHNTQKGSQARRAREDERDLTPDDGPVVGRAYSLHSKANQTIQPAKTHFSQAIATHTHKFLANARTSWHLTIALSRA
jgi:hypothetical protein